MHIFERGTKQNITFPIPGTGVAEIHDLWNIKLSLLDTYTVGLKKRLDNIETESFIKSVKPKDTTDKLRLDICIRIIEVRLTELDKVKNAKIRKATREKLLAVKAAQEDKALSNIDPVELDKLIAETEAE